MSVVRLAAERVFTRFGLFSDYEIKIRSFQTQNRDKEEEDPVTHAAFPSRLYAFPRC